MSDTNVEDTTCFNLNSEDYQLSPDMFSDDNIEASNSSEVTNNEPEPNTDEQEWKGISMDEIHKNLGKYGCEQVPPIVPAPRHTILFSLPITGQGPPRPYPNHQKDKWSPGYVRMPHSTHSLYPNNHENGNDGFRQRWEVIQEALLRRFVSTQELETAILSYNKKYAQRWDFSALHHYFSDIAEEDDAALFCDGILPKIIELALQLPALITGPIPLLKRHTNVALSLSQLQIGSLLANAFLCTFPRRNSKNPQSEYSMYPEINFNRLFGAFEEERGERSLAVMEKLKCIFHYFRRIVTKVAPEGVVTIQRRYIPKEHCPRWNKQDVRLPPLHITSNGTIETEGAGLLQVDFANKYVGGGVLGWGCVQEEIRFVICPELIASMLVAEALDDTEALIVTGAERYSNYEGYSDSFKWDGDFVDKTPRDNSGRRQTSIVAIDALLFKQSHTQFTTGNIIRELNKAYVGFSSPDIPKDNLSAIATGNWGCGAFKGDPQLKVLLQLIAAAVAGRSMVYFTFGDDDLRDKVADMYWHLVERNVDVGQLFLLLCESRNSASNSEHSYLDFYHSLYKRSKMKRLSDYFGKSNGESRTEDTAGDKTREIKIFGGSENTENETNISISFPGNAKAKEHTERQNIEKWLDDELLEAEFENDFEPKNDSNNANVSSFSESKKDNSNPSEVGLENGFANRNVEKLSETDNDDGVNRIHGSKSESELPPKAKTISKDRREDLKNKLFFADLDDKQADGTDRVKKRRLSGLESLGKNKKSDILGTQTLEELTSLVNNINDDVKVIKTKQKKISDFFI